MDIGSKIRIARKKAKLTQKQLAEKVGLATGTIQQYELGKREPSLATIGQIAKAMSITTPELLLYNDKIDTVEELEEAFYRSFEEITAPKDDYERDDLKLRVKEVITKAIMKQKDFSLTFHCDNAEETECFFSIVKFINNTNTSGMKRLSQFANDLAKIPEYQRSSEPKQKNGNSNAGK